MGKYYFTYGANHQTKSGMSLGNFYTEIEAESEDHARAIMWKSRGPKWAFSYAEKFKNQSIDRFDLIQIGLDAVELPPELKGE